MTETIIFSRTSSKGSAARARVLLNYSPIQKGSESTSSSNYSLCVQLSGRQHPTGHSENPNNYTYKEAALEPVIFGLDEHL